MNQVTKAVFPLAPAEAGPGPMAMTRMVDRPLIQYAIEEALAARITEMIFVSGNGHGHHGSGEHDELGLARELVGNSGLLEAIRGLVPDHVKFAMVRQSEPRGLGHALLCARPLIGEEPFAVILPETLVDAQPGLLAHMSTQFESYHCSLVAAQPAHPGERGRLCYLRCGPQLGGIAEVSAVTDDPRPANGAPPALEIVGRFVLTPGIFGRLETLMREPRAEVRLTDALSLLMRHEKVLADCFEGPSYDCTTRVGYLKAMLASGLAHPETGSGLSRHLQRLAAARA